MKNHKRMYVEYLMVLDVKDHLCSNKLTLDSLLMANPEMTIKENIIEYQKLKVEYKAQFEEVGDNKRTIHFYFSCIETVDIKKFEQFLRNIKIILNKLSKSIYTLRNDISFYYSQHAYPKIHQLENLMRKLITKFMITNVGISWTEKHIPKEVKSARGNSKESSEIDYLYSLDFIQLSNILFKEYSPYTADELIQKIKSIKSDKDLSLNELKEFVPSSNWERYFSKVVDGEADYLKKRWDELYALRNQVAHNNILSKQDFEKINKHVMEIKEKIDKAIEIVDTIKVSDEEKEIISNNILEDEEGNSLERNLPFEKLEGNFMRSYWIIDEIMVKIIFKTMDEHDIPNTIIDSQELIFAPLNKKIEWLQKNNVLFNSRVLNDLRFIDKIRNHLVHSKESLDVKNMRIAMHISKRLEMYMNSYI